ncbi:MAG: class I SAM-dependent methyltransferase [Proteobacteria bacterium]|nr:class I SAM-dependent methyltransferase [Pseudomonadota bacterium]MBU1708526.1 class I SAM-dependent methyltransferase [Pseudomonadota bacterium]
MKRTPEPELMNGTEQAEAYAAADFSEPHNMFVELFKEAFPGFALGTVVDLGCGPADISIRISQAFPLCTVHAVDGAPNMLVLAQKRIEELSLPERITLINGMLPEVNTPLEKYNAVISNSLLHHLHDPHVLWTCIKQYGKTGSCVFVMDLLRPESEAAAREFVEKYTGEEPPILKEDFYNSLLAAYTLEEVGGQLARAGLSNLVIEQASDRHFVVKGIIKDP